MRAGQSKAVCLRCREVFTSNDPSSNRICAKCQRLNQSVSPMGIYNPSTKDRQAIVNALKKSKNQPKHFTEKTLKWIGGSTRKQDIERIKKKHG